MGWIKSYWNHRPLLLILWIALVLRLIAVVFSKGYGMHDDHFLVIETAQSWLDGAVYNNWFLEKSFTDTPTILNFFYAGFHYILFALMEKTGITDPQVKMYVVRLLHALWSLLIVYYGFKITEKLSNQKIARWAGLLLASLWLMPFFSVRNLVEMVCIPFLMGGYWLLINTHSKKHPLFQVFLAALMFGLSFTLRFQTLIIPAGIGLVLVFQKKIKDCIMLALGVIVVILLTHGLTDWIIWGKPFTELREYVSHNIQHRFDYTVAPWYTYILVITGVLIPPVSFFLMTGFVGSWKKYTLLFLPVMLFFIFHSYYPNKQERFILPALPFIIMLGLMGWHEIKEKYKLEKKARVFLKGSWIFFWIVNLVLLVFFTTMYSKKARVEAMAYLSDYPGIGVIVTEDIHRSHASMMPFFYLQQWPEVLSVSREHPIEELRDFIKDNPSKAPSFVLFFEDRDLDARVAMMKEIVPGLVPETVIEPGLPDKVLHWLNPINANQQIQIYRNKDIVPSQIKIQDR